MRWTGYVARMGRKEMWLVGKPEGKRPLGRPVGGKYYNGSCKDRRTLFSCNQILFANCTSTFGELCKQRIK
jgi:hypothetical protein